MEINGEDPYNEDLLLSVMSSLRNVNPDAIIKKRKRRKRPPPKITVYLHLDFVTTPPTNFIPMPESDPRTKLPYDLFDIYGCGDADLYREYMRKMYAQDVVFHMQYDGKQNPYGPNRRYIVGCDPLIDFGIANFQSLPDYVSSIYDGPELYYDPFSNESYACYKILTVLTKIALVVETPQNGKPNLSVAGVTDDVKLRKTEFSIAPLKPDMPVTTSYQCSKYTYVMNADNKITKLCLLFKHMMYDPVNDPPIKQSLMKASAKHYKAQEQKRLKI